MAVLTPSRRAGGRSRRTLQHDRTPRSVPMCLCHTFQGQQTWHPVTYHPLRAVHGAVVQVQQVAAAQLAQQSGVQAWPDAGLGPIPQQAPGRHTGAAHRLRGDITPCNTGPQHVHDAGEGHSVGDTQPPGVAAAPFGSGRQQRGYPPPEVGSPLCHWPAAASRSTTPRSWAAVTAVASTRNLECMDAFTSVRSATFPCSLNCWWPTCSAGDDRADRTTVNEGASPCDSAEARHSS